MVTWVAKRCFEVRNLEIRLALTNLFRPGAMTSSIIISLGLGLTVLITIALIQANLTRQINNRLPAMAPAFFFIDIQKNQVADFDYTIKSFRGIGEFKRTATLRGRIVRINGISVESANIKPGVQWAVRGDRVLTYATVPAKGTRIVRGKWWPEHYNGPTLISLDADIAKGFGVDIGDSLTINILGREVKATISSLRKINWQSLRFDFAIIFSPGTLDLAPQSHIAALQAPKKLENSIEQSIGQRFNNITIIRVREALEGAVRMLDGIGAAIRSTAIITIIGGSLVLTGAVAAGMRRRIYDSAIFKVLGATRTKILRILLIEYGLLAAVTAVIASVIATLAAWGIVVFMMNMNWIFIPSIIVETTLGCLITIILVGLAGTWHTLGQKPAPLLRNE